MFKFPVAFRGNGKTVMTTQHMVGVLYTKDFLGKLKYGENFNEKDWLSGLKEVYTAVGKLFYRDDEESE